MKELKEILEGGRIHNKWKDILALTTSNSAGVDLVKEKMDSNPDYYQKQRYYAREYTPNHPLWSYTNCFYGKLPKDWEASSFEHFVQLIVDGEGVNTSIGIEKLATLKQIEVLNIKNSEVDNIKPLFKLNQLTELKLYKFPNLKSVQGIEKMTGLTNFTFNAPVDFDTSPLNGLKNLVELNFQYGELRKIGDLSNLTNLKTLHLAWCNITTLKGIEKMKVLRFLSCSHCKKLEDISALAKNKNMEYLRLDDCPELKNIKALSNLKKIYHLDLEHSDNVECKPSYAVLKSENAIKSYLKKVKKYYSKSKKEKVKPTPKDKLSTTIMELVNKYGKMTFTELINELSEQDLAPTGNEKLTIEGYENVLLWEGMSEKLIKTLRNLEKGEFIFFKKYSDNFDGMMMMDRTEKNHRLRSIPMATRKMKYKDERYMPHWIYSPEFNAMPSAGLSFF